MDFLSVGDIVSGGLSVDHPYVDNLSVDCLSVDHLSANHISVRRGEDFVLSLHFFALLFTTKLPQPQALRDWER